MYENQRNYTFEEIAEIAESVKSGDLGMDKLVEANIKNVIHLTSHLSRRSDFEDIVQDALTAINNCDINNAGDPAPFLATVIMRSASVTIARSKVVTTSRHTKIESENYELSFADTSSTMTMPDFESVDIEELQDFIGLSDLERKMLKLKTDGYTNQEIGIRLNVPEPTVSYTFRNLIPAKAKEALKNEL